MESKKTVSIEAFKQYIAGVDAELREKWKLLNNGLMRDPDSAYLDVGSARRILEQAEELQNDLLAVKAAFKTLTGEKYEGQ
jgi:hypothetical protein